MSANRALTLGDAGDDTLYGGVSDPAPLSMDFVRAKYLEFQAAMNALDKTYNAMNAVYFATDPPDEEIYNWLLDYEQNAGQVRAIAHTLNVGAETINALGGRVPQLSIPSTLGAIPLMLGGALLVAVSSVAAWIAYARGKVAGADAIIARIESMPENASKAEILTASNDVRESMRSLSENALSRLVGNFGQLGEIAKLAIVGIAGYFAFRAIKKIS